MPGEPGAYPSARAWRSIWLVARRQPTVPADGSPMLQCKVCHKPAAAVWTTCHIPRKKPGFAALPSAMRGIEQPATRKAEKPDANWQNGVYPAARIAMPRFLLINR